MSKVGATAGKGGGSSSVQGLLQGISDKYRGQAEALSEVGPSIGGERLGHIANQWGGAAQTLGGLKKLGGGLTEVGSERSPLMAAGNLMGKVGETAGEYGGPYGKAAEGLLKVGKAAVESVERIRKWNEELHSSNMRFAEFSASMSQVQAEQDVRDFERNRRQGDRRAGSARELAEAKSRLDNRLAPLEDWWAKLQNKVGAKLADAADTVLGAVGVKGDNDNLEAPKLGQETTPAQWMADLGWEDERLKKRRPKRLQ